MKNICFVLYDISVIGGAENVTTKVANALCDYYNVHVISLFGDKPFVALDSRIKFTNFHLDLSHLRKGIIPAARQLKKYYKENNIHISFLISTYCGFVCSFASMFTKTKQVFWDHGSIMSQWDRMDIRTLRKAASTLCSYTIVLTDESKKDYIDLFHTSPEKLITIPNWINIPSYVNYSTDSKLIISAGRIVKLKNFHNILPRIAKIIYENHPDWQWHIYGDGEYKHETLAKISELGLSDFVVLKGPVSNLLDIYKNYSIYAMTSEREGLPLVLLEAKASGLPLVAFDVKTGPKEIIHDGQDGYLIPPMDEKTMAKRICNLIEDDNLRQRFSRHGLSTITTFSKEVILNTIINFIECT